MALPAADENFGIKKKILHAGRGDFSNFNDGTKVTFHYQTRKYDEERTIVDDSKSQNKPMELIMGKKFKLEIWEKCLKTMKCGEVASFRIDKTLTMMYPVVMKSLRDIFHGKQQNQHCCGMSMKDQGLGYKDLDELLNTPQDLEFILDVQNIDEPGDYKKDSWAMDVDEKVASVPKLKDEGNECYKKKDYISASEKYAEALGLLEQLLLREKPGDDEWVKYDIQKIPLLLNFSQCKLIEKDYYAVIEHTSEVLKKDPNNVKALYRQAKAHVGVWNLDEARSNFRRVVELDPQLAKNVEKELKAIDDSEAAKEKEDRNKYGKMFG